MTPIYPLAANIRQIRYCYHSDSGFLCKFNTFASLLGDSVHVYFQKSTVLQAGGQLALPEGCGFLMYDVMDGSRGNMYYMNSIGAYPIYQSVPDNPESSVIYLGTRKHFAIKSLSQDSLTIAYVFFSLGNFT